MELVTGKKKQISKKYSIARFVPSMVWVLPKNQKKSGKNNKLTHPKEQTNIVNYSAQFILLFGVYYATARVGLSIHAVNGFATLVWPPTGIALAVILVYGYRLAPSIFLAACLVNYATGAPPLASVGIAAGNTLECVMGAYLLNRLPKFGTSLETIRDVLGLIFFAAIFSTMISATIGTLSLLISHTIQSASFGKTWAAWWVGDMLGDLIIAPLLLVWWRHPIHKPKLRQLLEIVLLSVFLVLMSVLIFYGPSSSGIQVFRKAYLIFPVLIWVSLRFGQAGNVLAIPTVATIAVWSTISGFGPFSETDTNHGLLLLQVFMGIMAVTFMTMAAVVSEQKKSLKRETLLNQQAAVLAKRQSSLMALSESKDEFVAIASHQLRTPATAVKQYLGLLLEGYTEPLTETQLDFIKLAYESNERQLRVADDLLKVTQLDLGKMKLHKKRMNITILVKESLDSLSDLLKQKKQSVEFISPKQPVFASVDGQQMKSVVENLLENASNYSHPGKKIKVRVKRVGSKDRSVCISVLDRGVGISDKDFPRLFKKFSRIRNSLSDTVSGSGLGLYFCLKVVHLHGGYLEVKSAEDEGSEFDVFLPKN